MLRKFQAIGSEIVVILPLSVQQLEVIQFSGVVKHKVQL